MFYVLGICNNFVFRKKREKGEEKNVKTNYLLRDNQPPGT